MEELRLDEDEEGEVEVEEEEEGEDVVEEEVTCEVMDDKLELDETLLMRPVKRPRMGSAQRLLLQEVAGSSVKRPVYEIGGSLWEYACSVAGLSQLKGRSDNVSPVRWSYWSPGSPEPNPAPSGAEAVRKGVPAELSIITSSSLG